MSTTTTNQDAYDTESTADAMYLDVLASVGLRAVLSAVVMLLLGVFGAIGVYEGAVEMMEQWHLFFEPTVVGTVAGMLEAAVISFVLASAFAWLYNAFVQYIEDDRPAERVARSDADHPNQPRGSR